MTRLSVNIVCIAMLLFVPFYSFGAIMKMQDSSAEPSSMSRAISVVIDPEGDINAVKGALSFPAGSIRIESISLDNSIVNAWIESPAFFEEAGKVVIRWAGIIPGGFSGTRNPLSSQQKDGQLFRIIYTVPKGFNGKTLESGAFVDVDVRLNDGKGTLAPINVSTDLKVVVTGTTNDKVIPWGTNDKVIPWGTIGIALFLIILYTWIRIK